MINRYRVLKKSWGGRGEHGFCYFDYEQRGNDITIYITTEDYNDWGDKSTLQANHKKHMTFPIKELPLTKEFVFECIIKAGKELNETHSLPSSPNELNM